MRLLICAGGTGGGVYPALAVLKALLAHEENYSKERQSSEVSELGEGIHEVLWIGGEGGIEVDLLAREKIPFRTIPAAGVHGVGLRALPGNLWKIIKGYFSARQLQLKLL